MVVWTDNLKSQLDLMKVSWFVADLVAIKRFTLSLPVNFEVRLVNVSWPSSADTKKICRIFKAISYILLSSFFSEGHHWLEFENERSVIAKINVQY